jgi:hypothetical protein
MLQEFDLLRSCIIHVITIELFFLDLILIARKCSQFELFDVCASSQFTHFDDMWKHDLIDLYTKHICIFVSWSFAQCLHFVVSLHVLIKFSYFWHLWHWLIRLFENFVTCSVFLSTIRSFFKAFSASFLNLRLILTNECVSFSHFSFRAN